MTAFFRTASFRLTAWYVTLLAAGFCLVLSVAYVTLTAALREQFKVDVLEELDAMTAHALRNSIEATTHEIAERTQSGEGLGLHYLMQGAEGTRLAGDLKDIARSESWQEHDLQDVSIRPVSSDDDDDQQIWGQGRILDDGRFLFLGQDADRILGTQEAIFNIFMWSSVLALVLSVFLGIMIARGFLRRINAINRTSQLIMAGRLKARIPVGYRQDEIDQLSVNLNRLFDSNQALLDSLKSATTNIAHDLRTPLSRLRQGLERVRSGEEDVALYGAAIDTAIADTEQILRTFAALLRISQIGSGSRKSAFQPTNLSDIVGRLIAAYAPVAEDQKKTLEGDIQDNVMLDGDGELLLQAAANLVENAIKHTPENARIDIRLVNKGETVHLSVADTGPGIPADMREKVLERFFRLEGSRSTPGSGLGLTLVHAVAELHGAKLVLADNHPGLRATLILPLKADKHLASSHTPQE
jgi:signal transduction histidine kinase